jgi:hypothetical protein
LDSSGYTHLEVYLNSLATPPSVGR